MRSSITFALVLPAALTFCVTAWSHPQEIHTPAVKSQVEQAKASVLQGRVEEAVRILEGTRKIVGSPEERRIVDFELAKALLAGGKAPQARAVLTGLLQKAFWAPAALELARTYTYMVPPDPKTALEILGNVIKSEPKNVEGWLEFGRAQVLDKEYARAIAAYEQIIKNIDPKELRAYYGEADALVMGSPTPDGGRDFEKALAVLKTAQDLAPGNPETFFQIGRVHERYEKEPGYLEKALFQYKAASEESKDEAKYKFSYLFVLLRNNGFIPARDQVERLRRTNPRSPVVAWFDGLTDETNGRIAQAISKYQESIALAWSIPHVHFCLANVYAAVGNVELLNRGLPSPDAWMYNSHLDAQKALTEFTTVRYLDPTFPMLRRAEETMSHLATSMAAPDLDINNNPDVQAANKRLQDYFESRRKHY